ncbi:MAG: DegT/DnrJ/EryC1/StrS family aminotransferase [Candidatus Magasanikbacteria bacterium]|nr:DegT/DnrJ/EryC1/StrS family aminotransferase [Candidatus Magasanikbacteria bacterium]
MTQTKIPWWLPQTGTPEERKYITQALDDNYINEGALTEAFESAIAKRVEIPYAVSATSCTAALFMCLKAFDIGHGDEVIVPDMTFIASANAVDMAGAMPVLVDVRREDMTIDIEAVKKAISPATKAIIPVHVTGRAADMEAIMKLATERNLIVIEDAAEALMSKHKGKYLGTWGHAGSYSFSPNKTITTGQGGMAVTRDKTIFERLRMLKDQGRPVRGSGGDDIHHTRGYNFKFTNLQAAVGLGQLHYLDRRITRMREIYAWYAEGLRKVKNARLYPCDLEGGAVPQWTDIKLEQRDELEAYLRGYNIDSRKYWHPLHTQAPYKKNDDEFSNSIALSKSSLWLPSAFTLNQADIETVYERINMFLNT